MMSIVYVFWMYVILFAVIGAMRGWAKELLVSFSVILALTTNHVLRRYIPLVEALPNNSPSLFWIRSLIVITLVAFGYQTVISIATAGITCSARTLTGYALWYLHGCDQRISYLLARFCFICTMPITLSKYRQRTDWWGAGNRPNHDELDAATSAGRTGNLFCSVDLFHFCHRGISSK